MFCSTSKATGRTRKASRAALSPMRKAVRVARLRARVSVSAQGVDMARRQKTLLCVDDNQSSLNIYKIILEDFGYKILTASSGREGLEVFASNAIDAVIL